MTVLNAFKRLIVGPEQPSVPELGRNERCWCGSGRKYKACHLATDERRRSAARATASPRRAAARGF